MAKIPYGVTTGGDEKKFIFLTTDNANTYPTDCGAGSTILLKNDATKKIVGALLFDGTEWNTIWAVV